MDRTTQRNGLVNLVVLLALGVAVFAASQYARSLAGEVAVVFFIMGALVAAVSWFQMRLEEREANERLEVEELARSKASSTLFEAKEAEFFPARSSRRQFEKYFVTGFALVLLAAQITVAVILWRGLSKVTFTGVPADKVHIAVGLFAGMALILFMRGRFAVTIARLDDNRLLRPGSNYVLYGSYVAILCAAAVAGAKVEFARADFYIAKFFVVLLILVAVETLITLIFEIYRPRLKGKVGRPLYDSRLIGLFAQPEGLVATAAQTLDYQFGFKVSETWFYAAFIKSIRWMFVMQLAALLISTCFVVIEPGEQALLERWGKPVGANNVLGPGPHLKMPWPMDQVYRYRTEEIQTMGIGFTPEKEEHEEQVVLWTVAHSKEDNFLVANREQNSVDSATVTGTKKAPPVSLVTVSIPLQFQITDLVQWVYNHQNGSNLLQQLATREVVRFLVSGDMNEIMSHGRHEASLALVDRIQKAADAQKLGARILFVGLQDLHPPVKVAPEYEKVVGAIHQKQAKIITAQAEAVQMNTLAGAQAFMVTNSAQAARINLELNTTARAAAFTNQIPAFKAAPSVYMQRLYAQAFPRAVSKANKYIILATNVSDVITWDLQHNATDDYIRQQAEAINKSK